MRICIHQLRNGCDLTFEWPSHSRKQLKQLWGKLKKQPSTRLKFMSARLNWTLVKPAERPSRLGAGDSEFYFFVFILFILFFFSVARKICKLGKECMKWQFIFLQEDATRAQKGEAFRWLMIAWWWSSALLFLSRLSKSQKLSQPQPGFTFAKFFMNDFNFMNDLQRKFSLNLSLDDCHQRLLHPA